MTMKHSTIAGYRLSNATSPGDGSGETVDDMPPLMVTAVWLIMLFYKKQINTVKQSSICEQI
jgi:hypothetical protein